MKNSSLRWFAAIADPAAVGQDDPFDNRETESGAVRLVGDERVENLHALRDTRAGVGQVHADPFFQLEGFHGENAAVGHRFERVRV